jgi:hypothetical protein
VKFADNRSASSTLPKMGSDSHVGQARQKRESFEAMLAKRPGCIYCAGAAIATTIEHMPPRSMFEGRQRPKGLEFPACEPCNGGTKHSDLVAAMLARCWTNSNSVEHQRELQKVLGGVANNVPGVLPEMFIGRGGEKLARKRHNLPPDAAPLRADGPILTHHVLTFAAKFGFALHYEIYGAPIPKEGGALTMWFSNAQALNDQIPPILFEMLPTPATLQQGTKSVARQFLYSFARTEGGHMLYFASFNQSFAVAGITAQDRTIYLKAREGGSHPIFVPGDFLPTSVVGQRINSST